MLFFLQNKELPKDLNDPHHIDTDNVGSNAEMAYDAHDDTYTDNNDVDVDTTDDNDHDHDYNGDDDHKAIVGSSQ